MPDKHDIRKGKKITFADGQERVVYPLTLKALRKFVKIVNKMNNSDNMLDLSDEDIDLMVDAAEIMVHKIDPTLAADREALEDAVDVVAFSELMSVAMGAASPEA